MRIHAFILKLILCIVFVVVVVWYAIYAFIKYPHKHQYMQVFRVVHMAATALQCFSFSVAFNIFTYLWLKTIVFHPMICSTLAFI